ncbi:MAG TPA: proline dehydrogenase family protein [Candidatus Polarisedimenticolia bacterium]|nr:proline dehydrogenase family protein [Candidatus Polarisedimenticolia bacterium]
MTKGFFLYLSRSERARRAIMGLPFSRRAARRFVVGETLEEALDAVKDLNGEGLMATLDLLGEDVTSPEEAAKSTREVASILDGIRRTGVNSNLSLKLTQLGLRLGRELCQKNLEFVLQRGVECGNFVRIDMEGSDVTEITLRIFEDARRRFSNVGVVVQAYLRRTEKDLRERLIPAGAPVRLCKGAYKEPPEVAFPVKADVDANYLRLADLLLSAQTRGKGVRTAIATHDEAMIAHVSDKVKRGDLGKQDFEFQMLYGIRRQLQRSLAQEGYPVRIYVSYGTQWYPYFMRRLAERPANVLFLAKNVLRG